MDIENSKPPLTLDVAKHPRATIVSVGKEVVAIRNEMTGAVEYKKDLPLEVTLALDHAFASEALRWRPPAIVTNRAARRRALHLEKNPSKRAGG